MGNAESSTTIPKGNVAFLDKISSCDVPQILDLVNSLGGPSKIKCEEVLVAGTKNKSVNVLELLISMNFPYLPDANGNMPLHIASKQNNLEKVKMILSSHFDGHSSKMMKTHRNAKGKRPYDLAKDEKIKRLLECEDHTKIWCTSSIVKGICRTGHKNSPVYVCVSSYHTLYFFYQSSSTHRTFRIETSSGKPVISGPLETIDGDIEEMCILLDPISVDEILLIISVGCIDRVLDSYTIRDILCKLRNGNIVSQDDMTEIITKIRNITLDKKIIPSVTECSTIVNDYSYEPISRPLTTKLNSVITKNKVFHACSDIARRYVIRDVIYLAVCESKTTNWWSASSKALCIAFKSQSESKEGVFRVFLLEFGLDELSYVLSISGPMADEHILKDYPVVSEVYLLTKVSVDNIIDLTKVCMMVRDDSVMDLVGGKMNGVITAVLGNCIKFYGDPSGSIINAKYLASKFQKVAQESLDARLQPSKVDRPVSSSSTTHTQSVHSVHNSKTRKRRTHKKSHTS
jgi:hypothetical protein